VVVDPDCAGCVVVEQAEAAAHLLPGLAAGADGRPGSPAGEVLAAYGRQVGELVAQVADWQRCAQRYAADLTASLLELRGVLAELACRDSSPGGGELS
jgi:hypothetical protein